MNKVKRKRLETAFDRIVEVKDILEEVKADEQETIDNLPDAFRNGERGEEMRGYIEMMEEAYDYLDDAASVIEQI